MGREAKRREGREREGMEEEGGRWQREWEGRDRTWDGTGRKGREGRKGKEREERAIAPNFNSWRRHCCCLLNASRFADDKEQCSEVLNCTKKQSAQLRRWEIKPANVAFSGPNAEQQFYITRPHIARPAGRNKRSACHVSRRWPLTLHGGLSASNHRITSSHLLQLQLQLLQPVQRPRNTDTAYLIATERVSLP